MTTKDDAPTQTVIAWLREDAHENAERLLLSALDQIDHTEQRRSRWPAWRTNRMNTYAKLIAAAAAVLVVAVVGYQFLPGNSGVGGQPTIAPSPSPTLLASGTFGFPPMGVEVVLDATGEGSNVTGTMTVSNEAMSFAVDLECALTTEDGRILIGGDTTESTYESTPTGTRTGIILKPGSAVRAIFVWQGTDLVRAPSCTAFLEDMSAPGGELFPIEGTVQFGP